ncbi:MAG: SDR family NAD(P)-dependent oxidoreductase [Clostridia bacterium]|nr:SDR family NAD(P)-dependent oxidoreductase [Clostridia bacterium]
MKNITVVTGATGGLGNAFVRVLAKGGENLLLTGRSEEKLTALKNRLLAEFPMLDVETVAADLTSEGGRCALIERMTGTGVRVKRLVNVAGADIQKAFTEYTQEKLVFQCRANFEAAVSLCHAALNNAAEGLEIINISSVSGIYPMPYFAIYSATKGALTSFSAALREEVKGAGVKVTAVLPGAMPTREDVKEQIKGQGLWGKLAAKSPEWVAQKSLRAVAKNKRKYIPGFFNKLMNVGTKLLPLSLKLRFIAKRWSKISKDAF